MVGEVGFAMGLSQSILDEVQVSLFEGRRRRTEANHANLHRSKVLEESFLVLDTTGEVYPNLPRIDPVSRTYARQGGYVPIDRLIVDVL